MRVGPERSSAWMVAEPVRQGALGRVMTWLLMVTLVSLSGVVAATGATAAATPLRWASCAGTGWYPGDHAQTFFTVGGQRRASAGALVCPIPLPDGATIRTVVFHLRDVDPGTNVDACMLIRTHIEPPDGLTQLITDPVMTGARNGDYTLTATPKQGALVADRRWAYALRCDIHDGVSQGIRGATVGYAPPATLGTRRWVSCGPWGFFPSNDGLDWRMQSGTRYATTAGDTTGFGYLHCGVSLPHGARLTVLHAALDDETSTIDVICGAYRSSLTTASSVSNLSSGRIHSTGAPGSFLYDDGVPDRPVVDAKGFATWVECTGGRSASDAGIVGTQGIAIGYAPVASRTRWVSCHGLAFRPDTSGIAYDDLGRGAGSGRYVDPSPAKLQCRLDLPDGWTVTESRFVVWDAQAGDGPDVTLGPCTVVRGSLTTSKVNALSSQLDTSGLAQANVLRDTTIANGVVDQRRYGYWAECWVPGSSGTLAVFGVTVKVVR